MANNANKKQVAGVPRGSQWNPQDDLDKPKEQHKQLYICCHMRRVEMGLDDNDDSGGGKAANENH